MRMKTLIPVLLAAVLAAACGDQPPKPRTASGTSSSAAAGATGTDPAKPAGQSQALPANPSPAKAGDVKPDPGDANDHSSPQHDARKKKNGD
jgi:hypothetical protein